MINFCCLSPDILFEDTAKNLNGPDQTKNYNFERGTHYESSWFLLFEYEVNWPRMGSPVHETLVIIVCYFH